jgi:hypothetical protein
MAAEQSETGSGACKLELSAALFSLPEQTTETDGSTSQASAPTSSPPSKRLNVKFVEWLMGLPEGWTEIE